MAIATYGPIADWCVSAITDMSYLFKDFKNFNADISSWDTSSVTNMYGMFWVRSARALGSSLESSLPSECRLRAASAPHARTPHLAPHRTPSF